MARYNWDLYKLRNNIKLLEGIYIKETNPDIKNHCMLYIDMYKTMIDLSTNRKSVSDSEKFLSEGLENDSINNLITELLLSYRENNLAVLDVILLSYMEFKKVYNDKFITDDIPINALNDDVMEVVQDFAEKMLPLRIRKDFNLALKKENLIQISYSKNNNYYSGTTFFDSILNKKYVFACRANNMFDFVIIPHELFHYLYSGSDICLTEDYNTRYNAEIEGSFANILFGDYFYENAVEDNNYFNEYFLDLYYSQISELVVANCFLDSIKDNWKIRMNKLNKNLETLELLPFRSEEEILNYLTTPTDVNMNYTFGYLVGIDLYYIYKKDPELAFYLLKNIKYIKQENDILGLLRRNNITFMDDDFENFKKYIKKIERQS